MHSRKLTVALGFAVVLTGAFIWFRTAWKPEPSYGGKGIREWIKGNCEVRYSAVRALEQLGKVAAPAFPDLTRSLNDSHSMVRIAARRVLDQFEPLRLQFK